MFKSGLEEKVSDLLCELGVDYEYESVSYAYTIQGYNSNLTSTFYYRDTFYTQYMNSQHMLIRGNEFYYWVVQEHWSISLDRYFGNYSEDGQCNNYIALIKRNNSTNDSFYKENHGYPNNQYVTLSTTDGGVIQYFNDQ